MLLARALVLAFDAKPIIICPEDSVQAIRSCAAVVGLHVYEDIDTVRELPMSMGVISFPKDSATPQQPPRPCWPTARPPRWSASKRPARTTQASITMQAAWTSPCWKPKPTRSGPSFANWAYPTVAIGDLGNEIGMGKIADHIRTYVPFTAHGECTCGCQGGILAQARRTASSLQPARTGAATA